MKTCIFHSVNSGLYFRSETGGILVDGLHDGRSEGFSQMPSDLTDMLPPIDGLLFTHLHPDHFSRKATADLLNRNPFLSVYGPCLSESNVKAKKLLSGLSEVFLPGASVFSLPTVHDGERFKNDPHLSYMLRIWDETFFIAGDAVLSVHDAEKFRDFCRQGVTAAFFNLYQLSSEQYKNFLRILEPTRIFLYHLPFKDDDIYNYGKLAKQIVRAIPEAEILRQMSWIDGREPGTE